MRRVRTSTGPGAAIAALALLAAPTAAPASSCVHATTVDLHFARGQRCTTYQGSATHFRAALRAGQTVVASSTGIAEFGDGQWFWQTTSERSIDVEGPGQSEVRMNEDGTFRAPRTGTYLFSFSPCAMWHLPGTFVLCAR